MPMKDALVRLLKTVVFAAVYAALLVLIVGFVTKPLSNFIIENDNLIAGIAGAVGFLVPIVVTFLVGFVLKKILNTTFQKMFMSVLTFLLIIAFIILFSYLFIDGFGKGLIPMLLMIAGATITFVGLGKKREKYIEKVERKKERLRRKK